MLYRMTGDQFEQISRTSLGSEGILEREDLQRILRDQPDVIEPGLFIVAEEFGTWTESLRSIDLLGIGNDRRLVVIELKRGSTGEHMELQAIRYAAMAANMTLDQIVDAHRRYLLDRRIAEDARDRVYRHLADEDPEIEPSVATERPRILLVSEDFSKELTTSVLWLNEMGLDIRCVRLRVYRHGDELLVDVDQVIPLPEAQDYLVRARDRAEESQQSDAPRPLIPGADGFEAAIADVPLEHQGDMRMLLEWARSVEEAGHTRLFSRREGRDGYSTLSPRLLSRDVGLVTIWGYRDRKPELGLYRSVFERSAPQLINLLETALGETLRQPTITNQIKEELLALVKQAYEEANTTQTQSP